MNILTSALRTAPHTGVSTLYTRYLGLRTRTMAIVAGLHAEDLVVQSMPDASPGKWHLAHTTWFFETFILTVADREYAVFNRDFGYLFNSYYEALGSRQPRPQRGLMTRPTLDEVHAYRKHVDNQMMTLLQRGVSRDIEAVVALGLAHEEQHQELLLMDLLHLFSQSPLRAAVAPGWGAMPGGRRGRYRAVAQGLRSSGANGEAFAFDNERPSHPVWIQGFEISDRLVTNGEWLAFMAAGGYATPSWWLSDGWATVQAGQWKCPLYWTALERGWTQMTLGGSVPVDPDAAVTHISYYEADAYARWAGARLPSEAEWETAKAAGLLEQANDVAWQWTNSAYAAYPGFAAAPGAAGEYNGKFMVNQMVLRGGARQTPPGHTRLTYRNFYRPEQRWMFSSIRLARDLPPPAASPGHAGQFAGDVIRGLRAKQKALSPKYFYDATGSALFEAICRTPEYYPTRSETALLHDIVAQLAGAIPPGAVLVEFGSGASDKTCLLLDAAPHIAAYVPIDISADALAHASRRLAARYPALAVTPVAADFTALAQLPEAVHGRPVVGFFPGSTIGNFTPAEAVDFLRSVRRLLGKDATLILGTDMVKDTQTLLAAYDDAAGVTAQFNKNLLVRINRELSGDFDLDAFEHQARWNETDKRIEMHLVSRVDQIVNAAGHAFAFKAGESLHTENSHKFTIDSLAAMAAQAGWQIERHWTSAAPAFAVLRLALSPASPDLAM